MTEMTGTWTDVDVAGHLCHVYEPAVPSENGYVAVYLHGVHVGKLSDHPPFIRELERHGLRVICPVTGRSWWTDRICPDFDANITAERYVLDHVLPYAAQRWNSRPPRIALFGSSMGGQGALRLAYKHPDTFPVVAAISPAIDFHLRLAEGTDEILPLMYSDEEQARQDTAILYVHPLNWPRHQFFCCDPTDRWWESVDRLRMKLSSLGVPFECDLETTAGGDGFGYYNQMAERVIGFLAERLEKERLRLPTA